ncbi:CgeB family protein [Acidisoma sp. 7E03]
MLALGHEIAFYEPADSWSRLNLEADQGADAVRAFVRDFPDLATRSHIIAPDLDLMLSDADVVLVHEWTESSLISAIGRRRAQGARFQLLFHDTHHRMVSDPAAMTAFDLSTFDGVLAFGDSLADAYRRAGWADRVFTWHEAADTTTFQPPAQEAERHGAVWIGNWGDGERSEELHAYLLRPTAQMGLPLDIYGVRYPEDARAALAAFGAQYHGWTANARAPQIFHRHQFTIHVPRRFYTTQLPGIPTIRVFEALACGIPLVSAPWQDVEHLFTPGDDFLMAETPAEMEQMMRRLQHDVDLRAHLANTGRRTIEARHTCGHRAQQLLDILGRLGQRQQEEAA